MVKYACIVAKTTYPTDVSLLESKANHTPYTVAKRCEGGVSIVTPGHYVSGFKNLLRNKGIENNVVD